VEHLVADYRASGLPVELTVRGRRRELSRDLDLNAYRILQEALTNTLKHAGPVPTRAGIDYGEEAVTVTVSDQGDERRPGREEPPGPPGHGLLGMRERVALFGGELRAGPTGSGGWSVRATLPLDGSRR
jgi:signal transduction histidine kinase